MAQTIDTKAMSLKVQKYLNSSQEQTAKSMQRLGSGLRINSARDDAAGIAIVERMNAELRGMNAGIRNANDGISMSQIAEGGLEEVDDLLQRMRELALRSVNGSITTADRESLNAEFTAMNSEISRVVSTTKFNGQALLDTANGSDSIDFQLGSNTSTDDILPIDLVGIRPPNASIGTVAGAMASIDEIDAMIAEVSGSRSSYASLQSQFESVITNLQIGVQNQSAARGRIMDANYAVETAMLTRSQILQNADSAMSSQANTTSQSVTQLLA
ncbi:MAG: flagellin [Granulosicoccus sp.]